MKNFDNNIQSVRKHGQFLVYFDDGSALFGGNDFTAGSIIEDAQITYFEKERSNNQVISYNGERYIISHYYSEYLDRNYVFMTPYSNLYTDKVLFKQYIYLSVGIIIYAVLMILALLLFRQIKLHIKLIKAGRSFHSQEQPDDTACLMDYMLNPNEDNTYKLKSYFPELLQTNCIFCISVLIEDDETFRKTYTHSDQKLLLFAFDNIIKEIFSNHSFGLYPIVQSEKNLIYIANYKGTDDITSHYQQAADRSIREILNYLNIQTSFYMSAQYPLNEMHIAYKDTRTLMQYSFIYKSGCILNADIIPQDEELFHEANLLYKQLKCCLETNNMQYKANMEALFTVLPRLQVNHIQDLLVQLLVYINEFSTKSSSTKNIISPLEVLHDLLAGEKNLDNILDYLSINIDAMILLQNEPPSNNLLLMIDKCKLIIDQEYADPSLCVEKIAERLGFSANYLGRKFKEYEGVSIAETLKSKRLDIAGEMIINTNYAIIDIINKSGFISPSHFNTAFKSKYGCTPSAYRIRNTQVTPKNE